MPLRFTTKTQRHEVRTEAEQAQTFLTTDHTDHHGWNPSRPNRIGTNSTNYHQHQVRAHSGNSCPTSFPSLPLCKHCLWSIHHEDTAAHSSDWIRDWLSAHLQIRVPTLRVGSDSTLDFDGYNSTATTCMLPDSCPQLIKVRINSSHDRRHVHGGQATDMAGGRDGGATR